MFFPGYSSNAGGETELKGLSWSVSTEMSVAAFFCRVAAHIYYSHLQY